VHGALHDVFEMPTYHGRPIFRQQSFEIQIYFSSPAMGGSLPEEELFSTMDSSTGMGYLQNQIQHKKML